MSTKNGPLTNDQINKYFTGWIGVSVDITDDYNKRPSVLMLDFDSYDNACSSYAFIETWQNYIYKQSLNFTIVDEIDGSFTFYFYTPKIKCCKKANFNENINKEKILQFVQTQKNYNQFALFARYVDSNFNVIDSVTIDNIVLLKSFCHKIRKDIKQDEIEFE